MNSASSCKYVYMCRFRLRLKIVFEHLKNKEHAHPLKQEGHWQYPGAKCRRQSGWIGLFLQFPVSYHQWHTHVVRPHNTVCTKVSHNVSLLRHLSWFLPQPLPLLSLKYYILPLFNYCDIVWSGCTQSEASRLETLHNYACCTVLHKRKGSSALAACRKLGLPTLASRRKLHLAVTMFNCMSSKSSPYLSQLFSSPSSHYNTCSTSSSQLNLLPNGPPLAKSRSVSWATHCGDPCHRTSETLEISLGITHLSHGLTIQVESRVVLDWTQIEVGWTGIAFTWVWSLLCGRLVKMAFGNAEILMLILFVILAKTCSTPMR